MEKNTLKEMLLNARQGKYAVGAFNIFNHMSAKAVVQAAKELKAPLILQTSVSTVKKIGVDDLIRMLNLLKENAGIPIDIHLDHCTDVELAKKCVDAGWDSVMIDASEKPFDENIAVTAEIRKYAAAKNVGVEGELGVIRGVEEEVSSDVEVATKYEDAIEFVNRTGVDAFAPAIGTAHGLYTKKAVLNFDLVKRICDTCDCPLVVHGGTGLSDDDFRKLIELGATKINISTAVKHAYFGGYQKYFELNPTDRNPLKLDEFVEKEIREVAKTHLTLFNAVNKA
jgi:fructose-bisphosphate aldolase class II